MDRLRPAFLSPGDVDGRAVSMLAYGSVGKGGSMSKAGWLAVGAMLALALSGAANGAPISYLITGSGTGTVGVGSFTDAPYSICIASDTTLIEVVVDDVYSAPASLTTISVAGIGTFTVTETTRFFNSQGNSAAGFGRSASDLLDFAHPAFATWTADTAIGPFAGLAPFALEQFTNLQTTSGPMTMPTSSAVTFQALVNAPCAVPPPTIAAIAVPVPGPGGPALALLASLAALLGMGALRRRDAA